MVRNDVMMTSLPKTIAKSGPLRNQANYTSFEGFDKSYPKIYFLLNLSHCLKSRGHICRILVCFTMTTHQI